MAMQTISAARIAEQKRKTLTQSRQSMAVVRLTLEVKSYGEGGNLGLLAIVKRRKLSREKGQRIK